MNKLLCIGSCCDPEKNIFSGQAVMFDGIVDGLKNRGNVVTVIDISPRFSSQNVILRSVDYTLVLIRLLYKLLFIRYDVVYITTAQSKNGFLRDNVIISICRWFHIPVIAHQYGANYHQLLNALDENGKSRLKRMLEYVSIIIVEGYYMKEQYSFLDNYKTKVKVIPNGLPIEGKHAQMAKTYDGSQPFQLFYLSNLIWTKGYFDVLQSVDILVNREHTDVKCVFAGKFMASHDDEKPGIACKEDFDKYIMEHNLADRVEYHPSLYGEEKDKYFYESNVFLLPSYYINEGQPVSIIEAMAYGCVPLVTDYRHIPMMIDNSNGCYVKPKAPEDVAEKIKYLIQHPDEYAKKSQKAISDYQQKFKFDVFVTRIINCMDAVIS